MELRIGESAAGMRADRFVNILDGDGMPLELTGSDGAAGNGFVAADQNDESVEEVAASDKLDGIGNHLAADQRGAHPLRAHGDAVGDGYRVEFKRRAAAGADTRLDVPGKFAQVIIAGADFNPSVGHTDERAREVIIPKAGGAQHGARAGAMRSIQEQMAA